MESVMDEDKPKVFETTLLTPDDVWLMSDGGRPKDQRAHVFYQATVAFLRDIKEQRDPVDCDCCRKQFRPEQRPVYLLITIDTAEQTLRNSMTAGICEVCSEIYNKSELISKFEGGIRALGEDWQRLDPGNMPDDSGNA
jgi:hypothetical protein